jgi:hypothetical protein
MRNPMSLGFNSSGVKGGFIGGWINDLIPNLMLEVNQSFLWVCSQSEGFPFMVP